MMVTSLLVGVVLCTLGAFVWIRGRRPQSEPMLLFRCTGCGQKVRYAASKAGRPGMCPRCGQRWKLPQEPQTCPPATVSYDGYQIFVGQRRVASRPPQDTDTPTPASRASGN
jgi:DNA-directed RNA polymerase subunit RPC12/RpoP